MIYHEEVNIYFLGIQSYKYMSIESLAPIKTNLKRLRGQAQLEDGKTILDLIRSLDRELEENRDVFPKKLIHFLEKRSYQKALEFIESMEK